MQSFIWESTTVTWLQLLHNFLDICKCMNVNNSSMSNATQAIRPHRLLQLPLLLPSNHTTNNPAIPAILSS